MYSYQFQLHRLEHKEKLTFDIVYLHSAHFIFSIFESQFRRRFTHDLYAAVIGNNIVNVQCRTESKP